MVYGLLWRDKWVHEHFHYALAATLGNLVNMFYRAKGPYQVHVDRETVRAFVSVL